ncbi:MAG: GNAT family N-acetyltransferase, partial [Paramuribaculum sp.]|nr:GNAT family N-acetyltransferase [Paramuribaculum sp.]
MIEYHYLDDIESAEYKALLEEYYGNQWHSRYERVLWYKKHTELNILVATDNGKIVGQSSVYKDTAIVKGKPEIIWWSVDTFVLKSERGKGIGKALQAKLHQDFNAISSIWYSRANGIIKIKCGAKQILQRKQCYY